MKPALSTQDAIGIFRHLEWSNSCASVIDCLNRGDNTLVCVIYDKTTGRYYTHGWCVVIGPIINEIYTELAEMRATLSDGQDMAKASVDYIIQEMGVTRPEDVDPLILRMIVRIILCNDPIPDRDAWKVRNGVLRIEVGRGIITTEGNFVQYAQC